MTFDAGTWWLAVLLLGFVTAGLVYLLKRSLFGRIDKLDESMKEISENSVKKSDYCHAFAVQGGIHFKACASRTGAVRRP